MVTPRLVPLVQAAALLWTQTATAANVVDQFVGRGRIQVLNASDPFKTSLDADRIGCINAVGQLTLSDCAVFNQLPPPATPFSLSSPAGNCTTQNPDMPVNSDSIYGRGTHAWWCGEQDDGMKHKEWYYTINGWPAPFICSGEMRCLWDIKANVPKEGDELPVWQFFWGSQQPDIEPGHWNVLLLWVPLDEE
ncbi:hypothetical protein VTI28DRAFT_5952 [Corynascus sepedonium]